VNSQPVEATWTDEPRKSSHARPTSGEPPDFGARTTHVVTAPHVRTTDAPNQRPAGALLGAAGPFTSSRHPLCVGSEAVGHPPPHPPAAPTEGTRWTNGTNRPTPIKSTTTASHSAHRPPRFARGPASSGHHAASRGVSSLMMRHYIGRRSIVNRTNRRVSGPATVLRAVGRHRCVTTTSSPRPDDREPMSVRGAGR
jgi:hypothetical protein